MMDDQIFERRIRELSAEITARKAPPNAWAQIAARLDAGDVVLLPTESASAARNVSTRSVRIAAMLVLVASAAIAALSTDTVQRWITTVFPTDATTDAPVDAPAPAPVPAMMETTLLVEASDGRIEVIFVQPAPGARIHVRFAAGRELRLQAKGAAAEAQFRSAVGRLTVSNVPADGEMIITIPTDLEQTIILVDGRMYLARDRQQLRILAPRADTVGAEVVLPLGTEP